MISLSYIIATFFGSGRLPYAPGTWGSLAGFIFVFLGFVYQLQAISYLVISIVLFFIGWLSSEHILKTLSYKDSDPSFIVIDEVAGLFISIGCFALYQDLTINSLLLIFFLFRAFDILKPWPICWFDKILSLSPTTAALGIMVDDMLAGIMAAVLAMLLTHP